MPQYVVPQSYDFEIVQGDARPPLAMLLEDRDPVTNALTPVDLTGNTGITIHGRSIEAPAAAPWSFAASVVGAPADGVIERDWLVSPSVDTASLDPGAHEFWATVLDSSGKPQTYPRGPGKTMFVWKTY
jgi:hypothetical protein